MAFVEAYEHDVFLSYAQLDDEEELGDGQGWVSHLSRYLRTALRSRLGDDRVEVYFAPRDLRSNHQLDELLAEARRSATFLAVASRAYAQRDWPRRELEAFVDHTDDPGICGCGEIWPGGTSRRGNGDGQ